MFRIFTKRLKPPTPSPPPPPKKLFGGDWGLAWKVHEGDLTLENPQTVFQEDSSQNAEDLQSILRVALPKY